MKSGKTGLIIAAAFIGPGTVTTASVAGASLGYGLVWALCFSIFATYILQEMASRLGLVTGQGLSEAIINISHNKMLKCLLSLLICAAIGLGNAAYEGGNLVGAAIGLSNVMPGSITQWAVILGLLSLILLLSNRYYLVEKVLIALVAVMSVTFIVIMLITGINTSSLLAGLSQTGFSNTALFMAIIGTTIVPYNLFLHASLSASYSATNSMSLADIRSQLPSHQQKLFASIGLGGIVTFAIMSCAANAFYLSDSVLSEGNIASQLEPILGNYANLFFGLGLFSAGLTSAITAPLAAGFAISGLFAWDSKLQAKKFKAICAAIVSFGVLIASSGFKPLSIIIVAQASNALLLPIAIIFLLYLLNQKTVMKNQTNSVINNILASFVLVIIFALVANTLATLG